MVQHSTRIVRLSATARNLNIEKKKRGGRRGRESVIKRGLDEQGRGRE
jgi:hypothetical protein